MCKYLPGIVYYLVRMANNVVITTNDFENICRTCLSSEGLKPLYAKHLAVMLMSCTVVKFAENDGLPSKICTNCVNEINKAFSFAKCCETTDKILRNCLIKLETEVVNNTSHSEKIEPTIKIEEEIKTAIIYRTFEEVLGDHECMEEVMQEEDVDTKFEENVTEVEEGMKIKIEYDGICSDPMDENIKEEVDGEVKNEAYFNNPGFKNIHRCTNSQIDDCENYNNSEYFDDDNQDEVYSEKLDNSGSMLKCKATNSQIDDDQGIEKSENSYSRPKRRCTIYQIEENISKNGDSLTYDDPADESYEEIENENQDEKCSEKLDNSGSRPKRRIHTEKKPHICEVCSKSFSQKKNLMRHMRTHTKVKPYICKVCSKAFSEAASVKTHMRIHTGDKPYICKVCSKAFSQSSNLQSHMRIHTGEKPHTCEVCNKGFSHNSKLKCHMRIHTGEKPYTCEFCNKGFSQNIHLKCHISIHAGEKPYTCVVCSKGFSQNIDLKGHMRIHTEEQPYTCKVCSKNFNRAFNLKLHMRTHTKEKAYTCKVCSKGFSQSSNLNVHIMRYHTKI